MHGGIPEFPEKVGLPGVRIGKVALDERLESRTVSERRTQKPAQRFNSSEGGDEG